MPKTAPTYRVELVDPAKALAWLTDHNDNNRRIDDHRVFGLVNALKRGLWRENGDAIRFDTTGRLADGQHRLTAIVQAGATIPLLIVRGIEPAATETIDIGRPRSVGDQLSFLGLGARMEGAIAAVARTTMTISSGNGHSRHYAARFITRHDYVQFVGEYGDELAAAVKATEKLKKVGINRTSGAVGWMLIQPEARSTYEEFIQRAISGVGLDQGAPELALRNWAMGAGQKLKAQEYQLAAIIRTYRARLDGQKLVRIYPYTFGEPFPLPPNSRKLWVSPIKNEDS